MDTDMEMEIDQSQAASTTTLVPSNATDSFYNPMPVPVFASVPASVSVPIPVQAPVSVPISSPVPNLAQTTIVVTSGASLSIGNQNIGNGLPPVPVGREFVRQYYTMMGKSPTNLYRFYSANSTLTFGNNPILVGQEKIRKDIEKRELRNCHAYIIKIDSQPTLGNGIVVQVIGELSNNDEPLRPFTQTFVLSLHIPKNFYVHNEIFRYQDELYREIDLEALKLPIPDNQSMTTTISSQASPDMSDSWIPPSEPSVPITTKLSTLGNINSNLLEPVVTNKIQSKNNLLSVEVQAPSLLEKLPCQKPLESWHAEAQAQAQAQAQALVSIQTIIEAPVYPINERKVPLLPAPIGDYAHKRKNQQQQQHKQQQHQQQQQKQHQEQEQQHQIQIQNKERYDCIHLAKSIEKPRSDKKPQKQKEDISKPQIGEPLASTNKAPMTYANVFKSASGLIRQSQIKNTVQSTDLNNEMKSIFIRSAIFTSSTSSFVPVSKESASAPSPRLSGQPMKVTVPNNKSTNKDMGADGLKNSTLINKHAKKTSNNIVKSASFHQQRRSRQRIERYDESQQLFLGNLPTNATSQALTKVFERYGTILELRVLSKTVQPGMRKLPNYGFLTYDSTESVKRCLEDVPFYFPENARKGARLNVRPKNKDENPPTGEGGKKNTNVKNRFVIAKKAEAPETAINAAKPAQHGQQKSLLMEDWPQLCGPSNEGGRRSSGNTRRKKDTK